ncbi:MAG: imidazole glycerol phosphate synthase subunit HisF [archaeon]|jgi:cyclase
MLSKRIIPCLDIKDGKVVKGKNFLGLEYVGDAVELAKKYYLQGADELVFLDITASIEKRKTISSLVKEVSKNIFIPLTVGGGIKSVSDIRNLLNAGADKVSLNTSAFNNPRLIKEASDIFGSQCIVVAIDAKQKGNLWEVFIKSGKEGTGKNVLTWAKEVQELGAGEIMLTSMDKDGTKSGYDIKLTKLLSEKLSIPIIASGGAGELSDISNVFSKGKADAAIIASILHYEKYNVSEIKEFMNKNNIKVRVEKVINWI